MRSPSGIRYSARSISRSSRTSSASIPSRSYVGHPSVRGRAGISATTAPSSKTRNLPSAVTSPISSASSSHFSRIRWTSSSQPLVATTSIRSCDSDKRISYGVISGSRTGTRATSISTPFPARPAISAAEDVIPAAPISWIPVIEPLEINSRLASRSSFSVNGSPT